MGSPRHDCKTIQLVLLCFHVLRLAEARQRCVTDIHQSQIVTQCCIDYRIGLSLIIQEKIYSKCVRMGMEVRTHR